MKITWFVINFFDCLSERLLYNYKCFDMFHNLPCKTVNLNKNQIISNNKKSKHPFKNLVEQHFIHEEILATCLFNLHGRFSYFTDKSL